MSTVILASGTSPAYGVQLTLNDLTGKLDNGDANGVGATMIFNDVASDGGTVLDLIITTVDSYKANNINNNKVVNTNEGQINLLNNTGTTFEFQFVEKDTTTPFTVSQLDFGLMDIDKNGKERVVLYTSGDYMVSGSPTPTNLDIFTFADRVEFQAKNLGGTGEVTNPTDATLLSAEQEKHAVNFQFNDISEFYMRYEASSTGGGRNFFFAGDVTFNDTNPVTTSFEVPFEFSPGLGLLLSGGGLISIRCLKKRKQLKS